MTKRRLVLIALAAAAVTVIAGGGLWAHGTVERETHGFRHHHGQHGALGHPGTMMGHGHGTGSGMMGPGHGMGPGMMGPGYGMGPGMMGPGHGMGPPRAERDKAGVDDVRGFLERHLSWRGNTRLKVGEVAEKGDDAIVADIVTKKEGALVERFEIDRKTGFMRRVN